MCRERERERERESEMNGWVGLDCEMEVEVKCFGGQEDVYVYGGGCGGYGGCKKGEREERGREPTILTYLPQQGFNKITGRQVGSSASQHHPSTRQGRKKGFELSKTTTNANGRFKWYLSIYTYKEIGDRYVREMQ